MCCGRDECLNANRISMSHILAMLTALEFCQHGWKPVAGCMSLYQESAVFA